MSCVFDVDFTSFCVRVERALASIRVWLFTGTSFSEEKSGAWPGKKKGNGQKQEYLVLFRPKTDVLLRCSSFVRGLKRKKGDSIPFILSRRDYM